MNSPSRRLLLKQLGVSAASIPLLCALPSLGAPAARRQRLIVMFTPNGTLPNLFWPDSAGPLNSFKRILQPLEPFRKQTLMLHGLSNKIRGDGDGHMRGMSCLLTAIELFPGNIQGGSDTPAGWPRGISIDQEIKNFLQSREETRTRLGSMELGVVVPNRSDPWTRMSYAGPNKPVAPIDDPYQVFEKLYGRVHEKEHVKSVLDGLRDDITKVSSKLSAQDKRLLEEHAALVREMEAELQRSDDTMLSVTAPQLPPGVASANDNMPRIAAMQIDLLASAFANDLARVATLQFTNSVGQAKMRWLGIEEGHHSLSHDPDLNQGSQEKLAKINVWFAEQLASLATKLSQLKDPDGSSVLDNTLIIWTNELGKGNSHSLDNIPFLLLGGGANFAMGRGVKYERVPHNRLWIALANAFGHNIKTFGNTRLSEGGPLALS